MKDIIIYLISWGLVTLAFAGIGVGIVIAIASSTF